MNIEILIETLRSIGGIMVGLTAISVHHRVLKEHQIDEKVYSEMKREQIVGVTGLLLMFLSFILQLITWIL